MISRRLLLTLVYTLVVLLVVLAVLAASMLLTDGFDDRAGQVAVRWCAGVCLFGLAVDVLLLVGAIAVRELERDSEHGPSQ